MGLRDNVLDEWAQLTEQKPPSTFAQETEQEILEWAMTQDKIDALPNTARCVCGEIVDMSAWFKAFQHFNRKEHCVHPEDLGAVKKRIDWGANQRLGKAAQEARWRLSPPTAHCFDHTNHPHIA